NDDSLDSYIQKINLDGILLWPQKISVSTDTEAEYVLTEPVMVSDNNGGLFIKNYIYSTNPVKHFDYNGDLIQSTNLAFNDQFYSQVNQIIAIDTTAVVVFQKSSSRYRIYYRSLTSSIQWSRTLSSNSPKAGTIYMLPDQRIVCVWVTQTKQLQFQQYDLQGNALLGQSGVVVENTLIQSNAYFLPVENNLLICYPETNNTLRLLNINPAGEVQWEESVQVTIENPDIFKFRLSKDDFNNIYITWIESTLVNNQYVYATKIATIDSGIYLSTETLFENQIPTSDGIKLPDTHFSNHIIYQLWTDDQYNQLNYRFSRSSGYQLYHSDVVPLYKGQPGAPSSRIVLNNGVNTMVIWTQTHADYNLIMSHFIYYQLYDNQGNKLLENNGRPLNPNTYKQILLSAIVDDSGDFIVCWSEGRSYLRNTVAHYIQKISGQNGEIMYPGNGILFTNRPAEFTSVNSIGEDLYIYYHEYQYQTYSYDLYCQKISNNMIQWEIEGRLIKSGITNAFQIDFSDIEDNIFSWQVYGPNPTPLVLQCFNSEGEPDENWPSEGISIFTGNLRGNPLFYQVEGSFTCILPANDLRYSVIKQSNGEISVNQEFLGPDDEYFFQKKIFWDQGLSVLYHYDNHIIRKDYQYENNLFSETYSIDLPMCFQGYYLNRIDYTAFQNKTILVFSHLDYEYNHGFSYMSNRLYCVIFDENGEIELEPTLIGKASGEASYSQFSIQKNSDHSAIFCMSTSSEILTAFIDFNPSNTDAGQNLPLPVMTLSQNYPNPFNPSTKICYTLKNAGQTELSIYNIKGQKVATLVNTEMRAGNHEVIWNGTDEHGKNVSSGVYFYRLSAEGKHITKKMILMK
nr:T9SS type A sorting domain-containing protein [Candidatus Cloacimonadota bacterium]